MKLKEMKPGQRAVVESYTETVSEYSNKLMELGISPGVEIKLLSIAPGGDPVLLKIRAFRISLRRSEADILNLTRSHS